MKIITEPTVKVVARTLFIGDSEFAIPDDGTDAERLGAFAAKGCYESSGTDKRPNIENQTRCIEERHGNVLEHATASLRITGITRACSLELNRHRISLSQRSTRYTKEGDGAIVLDPYYAEIYHRYGGLVEFSKGCATRDDKDYMLVRHHISAARRAFLAYGEEVFTLTQLAGHNPHKPEDVPVHVRKWARGKARNILPHGLETRGTWTANHRQWRWIIEARSYRGAEAEVRRLANAMLLALRELAPSYYADFHHVDTVDGIPEWRPEHSKV